MSISSEFHDLTHGWTGFETSLLRMAIPLWVGLIRGRAPFSEYLVSPIIIFVLMAACWILMLPVRYVLYHLWVAEDGVFEYLVTSFVAIVVGYTGGLAAANYGNGAGTSRYRRGATVADAKPGRRRAGSVTLAGVTVADADETKHFKILGTTGTGKSTAIKELLSQALARGDRAVIADPDSGYLNNFYNAERGDVILNPFETDSVKWNLLDEIITDYDADQVARSLIPDNSSDKAWTEYARTLVTAVIQQAIAGKVRDDREILRLLTEAPAAELRLLLTGTMAGPFLEENNERMFGSVRSVASSAIAALKYTTRQRGVPFSVRQWVRLGAARSNGGKGGVLFLPYKAGEIASLRSVISAWMRIAIFEALNRPEQDQRLWFVVDELDALGEIDGLKDALARLRKFGGRCVLGFQSISQVSSTYGQGSANTIVENCGNTLILRCSASEKGGTSLFASQLIGQREVIHLSNSHTSRSTEWLGSTTTSEHRTTESAVMASEIERIPDLCGFLKLASNPDWMRVALEHVKYPIQVRNREAPEDVGTPLRTS